MSRSTSRSFYAVSWIERLYPLRADGGRVGAVCQRGWLLLLRGDKERQVRGQRRFRLRHFHRRRAVLERAFRDDRREYYDHFDGWYFDELRAGLPDYMRYRNEVRGHYALSGRPSTTRLAEQNWFALPAMLDRLESFARRFLGTTLININGCFRVLGRNAYIPKLRYGQRVSLTETLDGLEAATEDGRVYLLRGYRKYKQLIFNRREKEVPFSFCLEALQPFAVMSNLEESQARGARVAKAAENRPRIAVAQ